jgi:hypothetical protein
MDKICGVQAPAKPFTHKIEFLVHVQIEEA